jgi:hypothetical protein
MASIEGITPVLDNSALIMPLRSIVDRELPVIGSL